MTNKRATLGDVFEIHTSKGLAYFQYTHQHKEWGGLIRVLVGFYKERPSLKVIENLVEKPHKFSTFFPLKSAVSRRILIAVSNFPVPPFAKNFPIFKNTIALPSSDPLKAVWWLWDGKNEWKIGKLSLEEQGKYPEKIIYNDTGLVSAIETGMNGKRKLC